MYRALLDLAHFGNTEIAAKELNAAVENLKTKSSDSKEQCKLEVEFEVWFFILVVCVIPESKMFFKMKIMNVVSVLQYVHRIDTTFYTLRPICLIHYDVIYKRHISKKTFLFDEKST